MTAVPNAASAPVFREGRGSVLVDVTGRAWTDLMTGFGAAFLGHGHPAIVAALQRQAAGPWNLGRPASDVLQRAEAAAQAVLPPGMRFAGFYSTGMEAAEFALRVAVRQTGRTRFIGFERSMHGKSATTATLGWPNAPLPSIEVTRLPFVDSASPDALLAHLATALAGDRVAAVFIEPVQGSNGAHIADTALCDAIIALCRRHGSLVVMDEILTGLYRTGPRFRSDLLGQPPDLLLFAKSMGNGFPVSAVALADGLPSRADAMPGSTFAGNMLAAAAVEATLAELAARPPVPAVADIAQLVQAEFADGDPALWTLRGGGALWALSLTPRIDPQQLADELAQRAILVSQIGRVLRLLPAATIAPGLLRAACQGIAQACHAAAR